MVSAKHQHESAIGIHMSWGLLSSDCRANRPHLGLCPEASVPLEGDRDFDQRLSPVTAFEQRAAEPEYGNRSIKSEVG